MRTIALAILLALAACAPSGAPGTESLHGRWEMDRVVQDGTDDVTAEHNPMGNRYFVFNPDGTFESGGDPHGRNTGRWTVDAASQQLHIDSDAGEDDDSYWIVSVDGDRMHWQGDHFAFNKRFALDFVRAVE